RPPGPGERRVPGRLPVLIPSPDDVIDDLVDRTGLLLAQRRLGLPELDGLDLAFLDRDEDVSVLGLDVGGPVHDGVERPGAGVDLVDVVDVSLLVAQRHVEEFLVRFFEGHACVYLDRADRGDDIPLPRYLDRKSTRLNSSHVKSSY